jgi:hypothetical protein
MKIWTALQARASILREMFAFLGSQRLWWLIPMMVTLLLLGLILVLGHNPVLAPFIYTLF